MANGSIQIRVIRDYRFPFVRVEKIEDEYTCITVLFRLFEWATAGHCVLFRVAGFDVHKQVGDVRKTLGVRW